MIDKRKLGTADVLSSGILDLPPLATDIPEGFEGADVDEDKFDRQSILSGLTGGGLSASFYYGCWDIWKTENGFSGRLRQYRKLTGTFDDVEIAEAMAKAREWWSVSRG